jgi:RHS repeat-associated protein
MTCKTDRRGYSFLFAYDEAGRCIHSRGADGVHEVRLEYCPEDNVTIVTKADGGEWRYLYDENGTIKAIVDPYGGTKGYRLDEQGRIAEEIDASGAVTRWLYTPDGKLLGTLSPCGSFHPEPKDPFAANPRSHEVASCPVEWDVGKLLDRDRIAVPSADDPVLRRVPEFARGALRTKESTPPDTRSVSPSRLLEASTIAAGPRLEYDELGLLLREQWPDGTSRRFAYDANGNMRRLIDREGATYSYEYASWNHLVRQTDPLGNSTAYTDTFAEKLTTLTDPGGCVSEYGYDLKDRVTEVRRHGTVRDRYSYDAAENLTEKCDCNGRILLTFDIGPANLPTAIRLASGDRHEFEYDAHGRITLAATKDHRVSFRYDDLGRRIVDARDGVGVTQRFTARGRNETVLFERYTIQSQRMLDGTMYGPLLVRDPTGATHSMSFPGGGIVARSMSNGSQEVAQYDASGRCLLRVTSRRGAKTPWQRAYTYSPEGNLLESRDAEFGTFSFAYDAAHRLTRMIRPGGTTEEFHYDGAGNLLRQPGLSGVTLSSGNRLREANGSRFEYNERQHVSRRETRSGEMRFLYDSRDMLVEAVGPSVRWESKYDPLGRRVSKRVNEKTTEYYWDTDRLTAEICNNRLRIYVYVDSFSLVPLLFVEYDGLEAEPQSGRRYFIYCNQIGAPILVEDDSGTVVWRAWIDPYGLAHVDPLSSVDMPLRFPGHYFDSEIGLHYNRFRYYDPALGRYIQSDPIGIAGGENLYAYTMGDPLTQVDVRGLGCGPERRIWSEEELAAAGELIETKLKKAHPLTLQEMGKRPVTLTPRQAALDAALANPKNQTRGGGLHFQYSRIPFEGPLSAADLHALTGRTGVEHGVVRDRQGRLWLTRGDPNNAGADPLAGEQTLIHTHPFDTPPSPGDMQFAPPRGGAVIGPDGRVTDYDSNRMPLPLAESMDPKLHPLRQTEYGQNPHATESPIAEDGTIDGNYHPITPIVSEVE